MDGLHRHGNILSHGSFIGAGWRPGAESCGLPVW
jgi:hypothetical protein